MWLHLDGMNGGRTLGDCMDGPSPQLGPTVRLTSIPGPGALRECILYELNPKRVRRSQMWQASLCTTHFTEVLITRVLKTWPFPSPEARAVSLSYLAMLPWDRLKNLKVMGQVMSYNHSQIWIKLCKACIKAVKPLPAMRPTPGMDMFKARLP